ncbi:hypothetical protein PVK06_046260 [Gossypium arboreum]|uniref:Uncharacterized protein n=1 Tax=Gossypium arboreum TaxID=29729 RepID=A0ABR0MA44_GOSAR|nr:hypothetical protein PVK06_046260 [Gossypium arboreum]
MSKSRKRLGESWWEALRFSLLNGDDKFVWMFHTKGEFQDRSAYALLCNEFECSNNHYRSTFPWKELWKMNPWKQETSDHLFLTCSYVRAVWFGCP